MVSSRNWVNSINSPSCGYETETPPKSAKLPVFAGLRLRIYGQEETLLLVKESRALWVYYNRMACNRGYRECCSTMALTSVGGRFKAAQINSRSELGKAAGNIRRD
jgi:hypothetical protein